MATSGSEGKFSGLRRKTAFEVKLDPHADGFSERSTHGLF
jgi:hypothetical protein